MARTPSALAVAVIAAGLLIAVLAIDLMFDHTYTVEVETPEGWRVVGTSDQDRYRDYAGPRIADTVPVEENGSLTFRLRFDNDYPWTSTQSYRILQLGSPLKDGTLTAGGRSSVTTTFTAKPSSWGFRHETPTDSVRIGDMNMEIHVGNQYIWVGFQVREVKA